MAKKEKKPLKPYQTLDYLSQFALKAAYITMGDYGDPSWIWYSNFGVWQTILFDGASLTGYLFYGFQHRQESNIIIYTGCLMMMNLWSFQRIITWIYNHTLIVETVDFLKEYTKKWEQVDEAFPVLSWYYRISEQITHAVAVFIVVIFSLQALLPILYYLLTGKMQIFFECYIPFVDYHTHPGFECHVIFHACLMVFIASGVISVNVWVGIMFLQICILTDVLRARLQVLANQIRCSTSTEEEVTKLLKDIFAQHQELIEYSDMVEELLTFQNFSDHFLMGITVCLSLFIIMQRFWPFGYILLGIGTIMLFPIDLLGTITEVKMEKLSMDIYDVPWYLLSVKNQKVFCYFLKGSQNTTRLTLMGQFPLSLESLARLYKGIYSYLMILRESLA